MYTSFYRLPIVLVILSKQINSFIVPNFACKLTNLSLNPHETPKFNYKSKLLLELNDRDILDKTTDEKNIDQLLLHYNRQESSLSVYLGIDITSSKIHIGTLLQLITLRKFLSLGIDAVVLLGSGTTIVGDPSFTESSRPSLYSQSDNVGSKFSYITQSHIPSVDHFLDARKNDLIALIKHIMARPIVYNGQHIIPHVELFKEYAKDELPKVWIVDNANIYKNVSLNEYLELVCNNFQLSRMLNRDCIKKRLDRSSDDVNNKCGMSFSELAYMTLQALDFIHLSQTYKVKIQIGGSDQWGNIVSGIDLAKSLGLCDLYGITTKLLLDSLGNKLSKSNSEFASQCSNIKDNTIWLSPNTCALNVWQFFRNVHDDVVLNYIKYFTDIPTNEIHDLIVRDINYAKKKLSDNVTFFMYGDTAVKLINKFWAFDKDRSEPINVEQIAGNAEDIKDFIEFLKYIPSNKVLRSVISKGLSACEALKILNICDSNSSAKNLIKQGNCYINEKLCQLDSVIRECDIKNIGDSAKGKLYVLIRIGKKQLYVLEVEDN